MENGKKVTLILGICTTVSFLIDLWYLLNFPLMITIISELLNNCYLLLSYLAPIFKLLNGTFYVYEGLSVSL